MPFKGLFNLMLVFGMFCFGLCFNTPSRLVAADWQLERLGQRWTIDDVTGAIHEGSHTLSEADGFPVALSEKKIELKVLSKSYDVYELPTVQSALGGSERQDRVVEVRGKNFLRLFVDKGETEFIVE